MTQTTLSPHEAQLLIAEAENRAIALEQAKHEMDILYDASNKLVQASMPSELLDAVSAYPREIGAVYMVLGYFDSWEPRWIEVVATWAAAPEHLAPIGTRTDLSLNSLPMQTVSHPDRPLFVEDMFAPHVHEDSREVAYRRHLRAMALLPLHFNGRWVGFVTFGWKEPRTFSERDERIFTALHQQLSTVAAFKRLLEDTQARATELELTNHELNLLYKTGELINSANTYEEVVAAVAQFDSEADVVTLMLWDTWDWDTAQFLDVHVVIDRQNSGQLPVGSRLPKESFPIAQHMKGQKVWLFEDAETDPRVDPVTAENWAILGIRSFMGPALYLNKHWLGGITFHSSKPRQYTEREERLLAGVGDLVLAAIVRIRLQNEKEQARQRAELLGKVNALLSQARDEQAILNAVAELFQNLGIAWFGLAYSLNTTRQGLITAEYVATLPSTREAYPAGVFDLNDYPCLKTAYEFPNEPVFVENIETDPRPEFRYLLTIPETAVWKAVVLMPLQTSDQWHGLLSFYWYEAQIFTREIRDIFTAIMPNVASIVTTRKAYLAEQEARKENELLYKASKGINNAATVDEIITALEQLDLTELHIALAIWEDYNRETATYLKVIAGSADSQWRMGQRLTIEEMKLAYSTAHHLLVVVDDTGDKHKVDIESATTIEAQGYHALMLVHLLVVNHCIGVLMFSSTTPHVFSAQEQRLAAGIGELVTAAIERMRLRDETEAARREAEMHAQQAQKLASLEERTRLARELHDSVSQVLYGIGLGARTARAVAQQNPAKLQEPLDYILNLAEAGLTEMRALIFELRPESLEQEGLITTLNKQALSTTARYGIRVETEFCEEPQLPLEVKESLYRIAREALHNTVKHAQATHVRLAMLQISTGYYLSIQDNGLGFDASQDFVGHLGLKSMRERTAKLGGVLEITSAVGTGTTITVTIDSQ